MPTIDTTIGGASSNSYAAVADADTYFDQRLQSSAWTAEDTDDKERALIMATRRIDQEEFQGERNTEGQALQWPRIGAVDFDGYEYDTDIIPVIVKHATYELALRLLTDDDASTDTLADTGLENFTRAQVGPLEVEIDRTFKGGKLPSNVRRLLAPVLVSRSSGRLVRS